MVNKWYIYPSLSVSAIFVVGGEGGEEILVAKTSFEMANKLKLKQHEKYQVDVIECFAFCWLSLKNSNAIRQKKEIRSITLSGKAIKLSQ